MARILTVLRSGGEYGPEHVRRLRDQVNLYAGPEHEFVCLTDVPEHMPDVQTQVLLHGWPGWWAKMEMFRCAGPCLYLDLDSTIVGDLRPVLDVVARHRFVACRNFMHPETGIQSSVMGWSGSSHHHLTLRFGEDPERHMSENQTRKYWGDQGFLNRYVADSVYFQDLLPGAMVSYKVDVLKVGRVPEGARVVVFHGQPRPWAARVMEAAA